MATKRGMPEVPAFRVFLLNVSEHLTEKDVKDLKFLLELPSGKAENVHNGQQLFSLLEKDYGPLTKEILCKLFGKIKREDLVDSIRRGKHDSEGEVQVYRDPKKGLEYRGYSVRIVGGQHYSTTLGEYVELRDGDNFSLYVSNNKLKACHLDIIMDDDNDVGGWVLNAGESFLIERPVDKLGKFTFHKVDSAADDSGIQADKCEANGRIKCVFIPEAEPLEQPKQPVKDYVDGNGKVREANLHVKSVLDQRDAVELKLVQNSHPKMGKDARFTIKMPEEQPIAVVEEEFTLEMLVEILREKSEPFKLTKPGEIRFLLEGMQLNPDTDKEDILKYVKSEYTVLTVKVADKRSSAEDPVNADGSSLSDGFDSEDETIPTLRSTEKPFSSASTVGVNIRTLLGLLDQMHPDDDVTRTRSLLSTDDSTSSGGSSKKGAQKDRYRCRAPEATLSHALGGDVPTLKVSRPASQEPSSGVDSYQDKWKPGITRIEGQSSQEFDKTTALQVDESKKVELRLRLVISEDDNGRRTADPPAPL